LDGDDRVREHLGHAGRALNGPASELAGDYAEWRARAVPLGLGIAGAILVFVGLTKLGGTPDRSRAVLGAAFLAFTSFSAAWILFSAIGRLAGGRWGARLRPLAESAIGAVVLGPIGAALLASTGFLAAIPARPDLGLWFTPGAVLARTMLGLGLQAAVAFAYVQASARADSAARVPGATAAPLAARASRLAGMYAGAYLMAQTILAFDLVMALLPHFRSALLGAELAMTSFAAGVAGMLILISAGEADWPRGHARRELPVSDLGSLLAVLTLLGAYLTLAQLMTLWYGNLREETQLLAILGSGSPWHRLAIATFLLAEVGPFLLLVVIRIFLPRFARGALPLALVALMVVVGVWLERLLLVAGPLVPSGPSGLLLPSAAIGLGGACLHLGLSRLLRWRWRAMGGRAA
jgi:hypothetical protein